MPPSQPDIAAAHPRRSGGSARARLRARLASRRRLVIGALAAIGAVTAALILAATLARRAPSWWRSAATDPAAGADLAERVERAVASRIHKWEASAEPWTIAITQEQANAWLAVRAPKWAANRAAPADKTAMPEARVRFEAGAIVIGLRNPGSHYIITARLTPSIAAGGALRASLRSVRAGALPVSAAVVERAAGSLSENLQRDPDAARALAAITGDAPLLKDARITLEDGRRVTLRGIAVEEGRLVLTCATDRPSPESSMMNR